MTTTQAADIVRKLLDRLKSMGNDKRLKLLNDIGTDAAETVEALEMLLPDSVKLKVGPVPKVWQAVIQKLDKKGAKFHEEDVRKSYEAVREANRMITGEPT